MKSLFLSFAFSLIAITILAQENPDEGFVSLFDGTNLNGWTPSEENAGSFTLEEGELVCRGGRAHLFYSGTVGDADFKNFELRLQVKTTERSNSGVYFHTEYQAKGWPKKGFEAQVNSSHTDPRKTGSLYGIVNLYKTPKDQAPFVVKVSDKKEVFVHREKAPSSDGKWFDYHIIVKDKTILIKVDGKIMLEWTQPDEWEREGRKIGSGTIGLQAHDPKSVTHYRDIKIKILKD